MASASDFVNRLGDCLVCDICFDIFDKPTSLPCGHTFCFQCIRSWCRSTETNKKSCPVCRHRIRRRVKELPVNVALQSVIADVLQSSKWLCQVCCEDRQLERATARCDDCQKSLCDLCSAKHASRGHSLAELVKRCDNHQRKLELHCSSCRTNICILCYSEAHRSHDCDAISKLAEKLTGSLKHGIEQLHTWGPRLVKAQAVAESRREKYRIHLLNLPFSSRPAAEQQLPTRESVDSFMRAKTEAVRGIIERYNNGMSDNNGQVWATIPYVKALVLHLKEELNIHAKSLQDDLKYVEELKKRAIDFSLSLSPSPYDVTDNEAKILSLAEEIKALLEDLTIKEVRLQVSAVQNSSHLVSSADAGSTSPLILSSEGDDQLEELVKQVTVLKELLLRERSPASSSPSQPPRSLGEHYRYVMKRSKVWRHRMSNGGDEIPRKPLPLVLPKPRLRGGLGIRHRSNYKYNKRRIRR